MPSYDFYDHVQLAGREIVMDGRNVSLDLATVYRRSFITTTVRDESQITYMRYSRNLLNNAFE